ncbi:hypothetical protein [Acidovorax sp. SUPP3334]|uniref:hypothetical protein n=1 Tax=Acidovorax sp. SUPP3334 TaxID=2920881 RepID=UPI0023DE39F6|nr:hypothetical protein [Acidovorax sp. SUPP3334]GKT25150.1 hypothetical protein AVHM3334_17060 [Acidovorax sp. SUPP3334]
MMKTIGASMASQMSYTINIPSGEQMLSKETVGDMIWPFLWFLGLLAVAEIAILVIKVIETMKRGDR